MILLTSKTNTAGVSGTYPYGNIKDDTGVGDGTPVDVQVYGDFHQFLSKMFAESGITANGLPDNATNGWQLWDALRKHIAGGLPMDVNGAWLSGGTPVFSTNANFGPGSVSTSGMSVVTNKYKLIGRTLFWQLSVTGLTIGSSPTAIQVDLPSALSAYKFANYFFQQVGIYNNTNNLRVNSGFDGAVLGFGSGTVEKQVHLALATGAFTNGTSNQSVAFSLTAELQP